MWRIGPFAFEFWHLLLLALGALLLGWLVRGFLVRIAGTWERVDEGVKPGTRELISLVQFGPFVRGRRMMKGGFQEYTGWIWGRTVSLARRDHGEGLIVAQGFPKELVPEIDGTVTARLKLTLSADARAIFGTFMPQKIEFTYQPPAITGRVFLEPSFRRYRLVSRELVATETEETAAPRAETPPLRKSF